MKAKTKSPAKARVRVQAVPSGQVKMNRTRTMPAGQFKTHCLSVIDEVHNRREEVVITKYGKPMARLVPLVGQPASLFGFMKGRGRIVGEIVSPAFPEDDWESEA